MPPTTDVHTLSSWILVRWMFGFLKPVRGRVALACLYLAVWIGVEILAVRQTALAVNQIKFVHTDAGAATAGFWNWIRGDALDAVQLRHTVLWLGILATGLAVSSYLREVATTKLSMHMVFHIRESIYDKLQRVGFAFHDRISTGELINRALTDLQNVRTFISTTVLIAMEIVLIVGGYLALLLTRSPWVAGLSLAPLPIWLWYISRFSQRIQPVQTAVMEAGDRNVEIIAENIAGVQVVKGFATQAEEMAKYAQHTEEYRSRVMDRIRLYANFTPVMRTIATALHLTLFLAAGILMVKGKLLPGDILMLGAAMGAILSRLQQVATINEHYQSAIVSSRRLHEILQADLTVPESRNPVAVPKGPGTVRFEDVTFGYDPAKPVLRNVSFEISGGQVAAIVGPTGAGKTTLVGLLARFYDPQEGRILLDGVDIRQIQLDELRRSIAYVFQETYLFSSSVAANVAFARPDEETGRIESASRLAQAHEFIQSLNHGYQSMLGERGLTLSGGQRQRLAIARAILTQPRILILDDALASVDAQTETLIQTGMRSVLRDRTTFVIAHRLSTVQMADVVVVLQEGQVRQMGSHESLMADDGHYQRMARMQLAGDEVDATATRV